MSADLEGEKTDFDTQQFIVEIQSRPALWDLNTDDYSNRELRRKCWEELGTIFFKKEEASVAEKNEFNKQLQRKWKSLRDCYTRERQRLVKIKRGSSVARKTQYVFYNQLSFLQRVVKGRDNSNNVEETAVEESPSDSEDEQRLSVRQDPPVPSMSEDLEGEKTDFDTEHFITEIQSRRALWDLNTDDYSNRELKRKCWEELVTIFFKKEASVAEKNEFGKLLQRKWKSLRDCYTRERQRLAKIKSGSSVLRKTQYVFYTQLSFLQRVVKGRDTSNTMEESANEERPLDIEQPSTSSAEQHVAAGKGKRKRLDDIFTEVQCLVNVLQSSMQSRGEREKRNEEDEDRLFLLSLLNPMKKIPEHLRFGVRMEIMRVIQNATYKDISYNMMPCQHQDNENRSASQQLVKEETIQIQSPESLSGSSCEPEFEHIFYQ